MLEKELFAARRKKFAELMGEGVAVIPTSAELIRNGRDNHYPHRPDSDFFYLTGFSESDALLVVVGGADCRSILFYKKKDRRSEMWTGYLYGPKKAKTEFGFDEAYPLGKIVEILPNIIEKNKILFFDWSKNENWHNRICDWISGMRARPGYGNPSAILAEMRLIKCNSELELMRYAAKVSANAHRNAMIVCRPEMMEYELEAKIIREFRFHGSSLLGAYLPIVASGHNACTLHYSKNNKMIEPGELVLIDAGCEIENYASDITRTFPANGKFSKEQRIIYEIVLKAQLAGISKALPGNNYLVPHLAAGKVITEDLRKIGLLKGKLGKLLKEGACQKFFPHGTSHWLGLDVHDVGEYRVDGKPRLLEPGMILTVEPGIYIPRGMKEVDKKWWGIGVRIEDDILITDTGNEVLSKDAPKTVEEIEKLMAR